MTLIATKPDISKYKYWKCKNSKLIFETELEMRHHNAQWTPQIAKDRRQMCTRLYWVTYTQIYYATAWTMKLSSWGKMYDLYLFKKSETGLTASVLKKDPKTHKRFKKRFLIRQKKTKCEFSRKSSFSKLRTIQKQTIHLSFASWILAKGIGHETDVLYLR